MLFGIYRINFLPRKRHGLRQILSVSHTSRESCYSSNHQSSRLQLTPGPKLSVGIVARHRWGSTISFSNQFTAVKSFLFSSLLLCRPWDTDINLNRDPLKSAVGLLGIKLCLHYKFPPFYVNLKTRILATIIDLSRRYFLKSHTQPSSTVSKLEN